MQTALRSSASTGQHPANASGRDEHWAVWGVAVSRDVQYWAFRVGPALRSDWGFDCSAVLSPSHSGCHGTRQALINRQIAPVNTTVVTGLFQVVQNNHNWRCWTGAHSAGRAAVASVTPRPPPHPDTAAWQQMKSDVPVPVTAGSFNCDHCAML
jgi:hypothetical protein